MSCQITIKQIDLETKETKFDQVTAITFDNGNIIYSLNGELYKISITRNEIMIQTSTTFLYAKNKKGTVNVNHGYGDLKFDVIINKSFFDNKKVMVEYQVMNSNELISHYKFEWKVKNYESN